MSGETEADVSAWTIDSLHSHLIKLMDERDRRYEQRFNSQETARVNLERETKDKFATVNEFRAQTVDLQANFMPRAETEQRIRQVDEKVDASVQVRSEAIALINSRLDILAGKSSGSAAVIGYIFGAAAAGAAVAAIIAVIVR